MKRFVFVLAVLALLLPSCRSSAPGGTTDEPHVFGSRRVWYGHDFQASEFVALDRISQDVPVVYFSPANVTRSSGLLDIAQKTQSIGGSTYTSGSVIWDTFNFKFGKLIVRAKIGAGTTWPAIWMLDVACQAEFHVDEDGPGCVNPWEIDIAEFLNGSHTVDNQQIHSSGHALNPGCTPTISNASSNWHDYELDWTAGAVTWLVDGTQTCTDSTAVPQVNMFLIMSVALAGCCGGTPSGLPTSMQVSSVTLVQ